MKTAKLVLRILLGVGLIIFGLNKFMHFMPMEPPVEGTPMADWFNGIMATNYLFPLVAIVEITVGLSLLINKFVPLTLVILVPVMLNAFLTHLFLDIPGIGGAAVFLSLNIILMYMSKENYKEILKA